MHGDVVRSRNPSKSTLAHDAVATAVLHKHHPMIRVGAGLIQFVYRTHLRLATEATRKRHEFSTFFARVFICHAAIYCVSFCTTRMTCFVQHMKSSVFFSCNVHCGSAFVPGAFRLLCHHSRFMGILNFPCVCA